MIDLSQKIEDDKLYVVSNGMVLCQSCAPITLPDLRRLVLEIGNDEVTMSEGATKFPRSAYG
jgi:hypothetical protein